MTASSVTRWLHSRAAVLTAALLTAVCAYVLHALGVTATLDEDGGLVEAWSAPWRITPPVDVAAAVGLNLLIAALMCYINKIFNLLRAMTKLQGTMFLVMETATPAVLLCLCPGTVLCLVVLLCMLLMMASYDDSGAQRQVFLVFLLLSLGMSVDMAFAVYIPVFVLATAQMRIFSLRTVCACLIGAVTPWVIILGLGVLSPSDLRLPPISVNFPAVDGASMLLLCTGGFTAFVVVVALLQNVMLKYLSYNAQSRAMLSILTVTTLVTLVAAVLDYGDINTYLPLLNCCAAMQLAHLFGAVYTEPKSFIAIIAVIAVYILIFLWRVTDVLIF